VSPKPILIRAILALALSGGLAACASAPSPRHARNAAAAHTRESDYLTKAAHARRLVVLPGLQYEVLKSGPMDGPHPTRADDITVRYQGRLTSGQQFGSSPDNGIGTETFPLQKLIPGWVAALQMMRPGDEWVIYIPANLAYGAAGKGNAIPPDSTLVFRIELVSISKHADAPSGS
jgi:peptidylprolyl isomerase/FKBP-type peptidyl-prolyl cis-trans isomerase FklB